MSNLFNFIKVINWAVNNQLRHILEDYRDSDFDNLALAYLITSPTSKYEKMAVKDSRVAGEYAGAFEVLGAKRAAGYLSKYYKDKKIKFKNTEKHELVQEYVKKHGFESCKTLVGDVREEAKRILSESLSEGYDPHRTATMLRRIPDNPINKLPRPRFRAETIARTESGMALNKGSDEFMRSYGVKMANWITAGDMFVCSLCLHMEAHNPHLIRELPLLLHPRCRCTRTYVMPKKVEYNPNYVPNMEMKIGGGSIK